MAPGVAECAECIAVWETLRNFPGQDPDVPILAHILHLAATHAEAEHYAWLLSGKDRSPTATRCEPCAAVYGPYGQD